MVTRPDFSEMDSPMICWTVDVRSSEGLRNSRLGCCSRLLSVVEVIAFRKSPITLILDPVFLVVPCVGR